MPPRQNKIVNLEKKTYLLWYHLHVNTFYLHLQNYKPTPKYTITSFSECRDNCKSNQGNQRYIGNQKNVIHGQRPNMEKGHTQQRT